MSQSDNLSVYPQQPQGLPQGYPYAPPRPQAYPLPNRRVPPQNPQQGVNPPPVGNRPQAGGYPVPQGGGNPRQQGYPRPQGYPQGYPRTQAGGYPVPQGGGYPRPQQGGGYPVPQAGGYPRRVAIPPGVQLPPQGAIPRQPQGGGSRGTNPQQPRPRFPQRRPPSAYRQTGYDVSGLRSNEFYITFINKSGRRAKIYQSDRDGYEIMYRFMLRPNEPRTVIFPPDNSYFIAYDYLTNQVLMINRRRRMETRFMRPGFPIDAIIGTYNLRPEPYPKGKLLPRYLETLVVLDDTMVDFHGAFLDQYVLTLMNIVARIFMHKSLRAPMFIAVTKIVKMETPPKYYKIERNKPSSSAGAACRYSQTFYNSSYTADFALTLTRKDIGPTGYAALYTVCSKQRSCAIVKDRNADTAFAIAHEIAHALGIAHDEDDNCIRASSKSIMAGRLRATSSGFQWSRCSQRMLRENIRHLKCLKNVPKLLPAFKESMMNLPGEILSLDKQCQLHFGNQSKACTRRMVSMCRFLWCHPKPGEQCKVLHLHSPVQGSKCDKDKWCMQSTCIIKKKQLPIDGGWSGWSPYLPVCNSESITWIIQTRNRSCTKPKPEFNGKPCVGKKVEKRMVLPKPSGQCVPYTFVGLLLNKVIDSNVILNDGCAAMNRSNLLWNSYSRKMQIEFVTRSNMTCDFEGPGCAWKSSKKGVKGWNLAHGPTSSGQTGPTHDHTLKTAEGNYLYYETSWIGGTPQLQPKDRIILESPLILAPEACLRFAYHMFGSDIGGLEVHLNNGKFRKRVWHKQGPQGNKWHKASIELPITIEYKITIEAIRGNSYRGDIAIDDLKFEYGLCKNDDQSESDSQCLAVCVGGDYKKMVRASLRDGTPCASDISPNSVCYQKKCTPVNCDGIIGKSNC